MRHTDPAHSADSRTASNTSILLASCGAVATAYYLGAAWLGTSVIGLPLGLWAVPLTYAAVRWGERVNVDGALRALGAGAKRLRSLVPGVRTGIDPSALGHRFLSGSGFLFSAGASSRREPSAPLSDRYEIASGEPLPRVARRTGAIRIGVNADPETTRRLVTRDRTPGFEWIATASSGGPAAATELRLDAMISRRDGRLVITTHSAHDLGSAWDDWSHSRDATYPTVFPTRIDPERVSLAGCDMHDDFDVELAHALAEAAGATTRACDGAPAAQAAVATAMMRLRDLVARAALRSEPPPTAHAAARAVTAWLSTCEGEPDASARLEAFEAAARLLPGDAEVALRLAAARFSAGTDGSAFDALRRADSLLRQRSRTQAVLDQVPFIQSELECGSNRDPMIVGRIAAGLCLACAAAPATALAYLEEDVMDDMRYSPWMVGRDHDRMVLMKVLRELQRMHRGMGEAQAA